MDSLAYKLWQLHQLTAQLRVGTILKATALLKEKYQKDRGGEVAVAIALHYWLLAMRADTGDHRSTSENCISLAARLRNTACRWLRRAGQNVRESPRDGQQLSRAASNS